MNEAASILAPFLVLSNNVVFNFDETDVKSALTHSVNMMMQVTELIKFDALK